MSNFKKPTTKATQIKGIDALTIAAGGILGKGLSGFIPASVNPKLAKLGLFLTGVIAATTTSNKKLSNLGIGVAATQILDLGSETISGMIPKTGQAQVDKFLESAFDTNTALAGITAGYNFPQTYYTAQAPRPARLSFH